MKSVKPPKVNSLSLARNASQFYTKIEFDLQPLLQDKVLAETLEKIVSSITKLEKIVQSPEKIDAAELTSEFQKTDKALEKLKTKVNDIQSSLDKVEKSLHEKLELKFEILKKTDPKDSTDAANRSKVEAHMKLIKQIIETAKKKLHEIQGPTEQALKRLHAIKPKLYALGISENFDRCQKKAEKLSDEVGALCNATAEMALSDMAVSAAALLKEIPPIRTFLPKLRAEIEKSGKLLLQADIYLSKVLPQDNIAPASVPASVQSSAAVSIPASIPVSASLNNPVSIPGNASGSAPVIAPSSTTGSTPVSASGNVPENVTAIATVKDSSLESKEYSGGLRLAS